jgi:hypothetical protein
VSAGTALIGRYHEAGVQTFTCGRFKNDREARELFASDVIPHFA